MLNSKLNWIWKQLNWIQFCELEPNLRFYYFSNVKLNKQLVGIFMLYVKFLEYVCGEDGKIVGVKEGVTIPSRIKQTKLWIVDGF